MLNHPTLKTSLVLVFLATLASVGIFILFVSETSSEPGIVTLEQSDMERLIAGDEHYKQGEKQEDQEGEFCSGCEELGCDEYKMPCERKFCIFRPDWYECLACTSGADEYYAANIYLSIESWCFCDDCNNCKYDSKEYFPKLDCEFKIGTCPS